MRKITAQEFNERYDALPEELQDAMYSIDTKAAVQEIAAAERLHIDQTGALNYLIALVMLGFIDTDEFAGEVERELKVDKQKADAITKRVNEKIFLPIRELLKKEAAPQAPAVGTPSVASPMPEPVDRASILNEIENPVPAAPILAAPAASPSASVVPPPTTGAPPTIPSAPEQPAPAAAPSPMREEKRDIVSEKLGGTTSATAEEVNVGRNRSSYKVDPYREPPE